MLPFRCKYGTTGHPLQSLADAITMEEFKTDHRPKVVFHPAPHPKALPQAVANSFVQMMQLQDADFVITHPKVTNSIQKLLKTPRLSTIRIKHLKMLILSTPKTGAVTKITVKSLITT
jgi:ornithine carbamoyltransferase